MTPSSTISSRAQIQDIFVTRAQILFTSFITLLGSLLYLVPHFPFNPKFCIVALISCVMHLAMYLFFDFLTTTHFHIANFINLIMMGFSIHYTGGILSPYSMVFVLILISGAYYGIKYHAALIAAFIIYLSVIIAEFKGLLEPWVITPADLYRSWPTSLLVVVSIMGLMVISDSIYKITVKNLRGNLEKESVLKQSIMTQLSKLEASSQMGLLVNKIVHDIRGPLGAITGFVKILENENKLNPESQEDCRVMLAELDRITNLVNKMMKYTRPGQVGRNLICPMDVIETVLSVISFYPGFKGITITKNFPPPGKVLIYANKEELQQVIFNILKNSTEALHDMKVTRRIDLKVSIQGSNVAIQVKDNGKGIPRHLVNKVLHDAVSTKKEGGGIGLTIVKEILEGHKGHLEIDSIENAGTTITLYFPITGKESATQLNLQENQSPLEESST